METVDLSLLTLNPHNSKDVSPEGFQRTKKQLILLGQFKPLLITRKNMIVGGHTRYHVYDEVSKLMPFDVLDYIKEETGRDVEERIALNIIERAKTPYVSYLDFENKDGGIVAFIDGQEQPRVFKTIEQAIAEYSLADNDVSGHYTTDIISLIDQFEINPLDYAVNLEDLPTLDSIMPKKEVKEDEAPSVDNENPPKSELGKVYQLGIHRIMCGDATKIEEVEKLMDGQKADMVFTDPPYGVSYAAKNEALNAIAPGNRIQTPIENDHKTVDERYQLWLAAFSNINAISKEGFSYYVCSPQGGELMMMMMMALRDSGLQVKHTIVWVKNNIVIGRSDYHYKHEPILYGWGKGTHQFYGGRTKNSVWSFDKPLKSDLHPTMKPIALVVEAINNSSKSEDIVLDLFGGSGSTLIACEQTNRTCYMMELDPRYCDVIRKRYAQFIGKDNEWESITPEV